MKIIILVTAVVVFGSTPLKIVVGADTNSQTTQPSTTTSRVESKATNTGWAPEKPDAIYGAIAGGFVAFVISLFTNRAALRRQSLELAHQSQQKESDRKHALKREVYIPLFESFASATSFVSTIPTMPLETFRAQEPINALGRQIAKLNLIAPREVLEPTHVALRTLSKSVMRLAVGRLEIEKATAELTSISKSIEASLSDQKSLTTRFERHLDEATKNRPVMESIDQSFKQIAADFEGLLSRQRWLIGEKARLELDLTQRCLEEQRPIIREFCTALAAIRQDLGMGSDFKWLLDFFNTGADEMRTAAGQFLKEIKDKLSSDLGHPLDGNEQPKDSDSIRR